MSGRCSEFGPKGSQLRPGRNWKRVTRLLMEAARQCPRETSGRPLQRQAPPLFAAKEAPGRANIQRAQQSLLMQ